MMELIKPLNRYFDHTLLKPDATCADIKRLCAEAKEQDFYAVCVNSSYVALAVHELMDCRVKIAAVVGFPLGAATTETKVFEAVQAIERGASEIDMVLNVGALKEGRYQFVRSDIAAVVEAARKKDAIVKVIIETCLLTNEEKRKACELAVEATAAFVKTSTGFSTGGATAEDVALMRAVVKNRAFVKASGGIRDLKTALAMIEAGADRLGASASVSILQEYLLQEKYGKGNRNDAF